MDYRKTVYDFGWVVTSPFSTGAKYDVDGQRLNEVSRKTLGGYNARRGGGIPWTERSTSNYLIGLDRELPHAVTDSAASATSIFSGKKTYNGSINVGPEGQAFEPLARELQREMDWKVGVVTSVPVSHATPASAYANNVTRKDYQDISRDMIGLPSSFHSEQPLPGLDVLIGGGHGEGKKEDRVQGENFRCGNPYLHQEDLREINVENGGRYVVVTRQSGVDGGEALQAAAEKAANSENRLMGFYGVRGGHLPFRTTNGDYRPTFDIRGTEKYEPSDIEENVTLAEMTRAALTVLERSIEGFYLAIEAGDVDWANHANNLDSSIGAVLSGAEAFDVVTQWVEENDAWDHTAVIITADHGHFLVIDDDRMMEQAGQRLRANRKAQVAD